MTDLDELQKDFNYSIIFDFFIDICDDDFEQDIKEEFYKVININKESDNDVAQILKGIRLCDFDSYMKLEDDLKFGDLRLLEVDNPVYIPFQEDIRFFITSMDVIHS